MTYQMGNEWRKERGLVHRLYITAEQKTELRALAKRLGLSPAETVEHAVRALLSAANAEDADRALRAVVQDAPASNPPPPKKRGRPRKDRSDE